MSRPGYVRTSAQIEAAKVYRRDRLAHYAKQNGKIPGLQVLCANCNTIKQLRYSRSKTIKDPAILQEVQQLYATHHYSS